jgi:hypothetical protein
MKITTERVSVPGGLMRSMMRTGLALLCVMLVSATSAIAGMATISNVKGEVMVFAMTGPGWIPVTKGMSLEFGDNLKTASGSAVKIRLSSGSQVVMQHEGQIAIQPELDGTAALALFEGKLSVLEGPVIVHNSESGEAITLRSGQSYGASAPVLIDEASLVIDPVFYQADLTDPNCWPRRDGQAQLSGETAAAEPTITLTLGDGAAQFNSRWIFKGEIDLNQAPCLDMSVRVKQDGPVSILFHIGDDKVKWHQLPIVKKQPQFPMLLSGKSVDGALSDGQWHRLTWNLKQIVQKNFGADVSTISDVIIGKWTAPETVGELEIRSFKLGEASGAF